MRRHRFGTERGAAAVEFALVVVPLLVIVFGTLTYGFMLSFRQSVSQAAAEGARAIAVAPSTANRTLIAYSAIEKVLSQPCNTGVLTCAVTTPASCATCLSVRVSWDYENDSTKPKLVFGFMIPKTLAYTSTTEVNQAGQS